MEGTRALLALFAALLTTTSVRGDITVAIQNDQLSRQPQLGSNFTLTCKIEETPFYQGQNERQWAKQQYGDQAWLNVQTLSPRYVVSSLTQTSPSEFMYVLTIVDFKPVDVGNYRCWVPKPAIPGAQGKLSDDIAISTGVQSATVLASTDAPLDPSTGAYFYESHATTTCEVSVEGTATVSVQVLYNGHDRTQDFSVDKKVARNGTTPGMQVTVQTVTLVSHTFIPLTRTPTPLDCIAYEENHKELGRQSFSVALKTFPKLTCVQSGNLPAYLSDLNVMITCTAQDYDWHTTSRIDFSFTALENGLPATVVVDNNVEKHGHTKVDDIKDGKHSLKINRITSEVVEYPEYNVTLTEEGHVLASSNFMLSVLNKARSSQPGKTDDATIASASFLTTLFLPFVALLKPW